MTSLIPTGRLAARGVVGNLRRLFAERLAIIPVTNHTTIAIIIFHTIMNMNMLNLIL